MHFGELGTPGGCAKTGLGPAGPYAATALCTGNESLMACCNGQNAGSCSAARGACIDLGSNAVSLVGSGVIFSNSGPLLDIAFETALDGSISGPAAFAAPPAPPRRRS